MNDGERDFWKGQIDFDEVVNKKLTDENIIRRDAWCYGNWEYVMQLYRPVMLLDNQRLIDYGIENLRLTMNNIKGIFFTYILSWICWSIPSIKFGRNVVTKGVFFFRKGTLEE